MDINQAIKSIHHMAINTKSVINIMYTSRMVEEAINAVLKPFDISIQQYNVMRILRGQKGKPANLSTLQERMVDRSSNTTRLVDKLVNKALVKRQVCKENRRKVEIFITTKGLDLLKELDPITEENNQKIVSNLSIAELESLNSLLDQLRNQ